MTVVSFINQESSLIIYLFDYHHFLSLWESIIIGLITGFVNYTVNTNHNEMLKEPMV